MTLSPSQSAVLACFKVTPSPSQSAVMGRKPLDIATRFHNKYIPEPNSGCWIWSDNVDQQGYGQLKIGSLRDGSRTNAKAHRISWIIHNGPIPSNLLICHKCDNPACVNPHHLFVGNSVDNMQDHVLKDRPHGSKKLSLKQAQEIRFSQESNKCLAQKYGLSKSHVWKIRNGHKWKALNLLVTEPAKESEAG